MVRGPIALAAAVMGAVLLPSAARAADCELSESSYAAAMTFRDAGSLEQTRMNIAFDGTELWTSSGGSTSGRRLSRYSAGGSWIADYSPGRDLRSVFARGDGTSPLYLRSYNSRNIEVMNTPGVATSFITLSGGTLDAQAAVVWDDDRDEYIAMTGGRVDRWNSGGSWVTSVTLSGFGGTASENTYPQNRGIAWTQGCYLTYSNGTLSTWDMTGARVSTATLTGAGSSFDSHFSFGFAEGLVWVLDSAFGTWRGYDLGTIGCDDLDGDGHGDPACGGDDCNDADATIYPGAPELCDGRDNDCDGTPDDGACCPDDDGDGHDAAWCGGDDCDDTDPLVFPGAPEICYGADNDCDGIRDEDLPFDTYFLDTDGDGYGSPALLVYACAPPSGYVADNTDCDDLDPTVNPGAPEVCDSQDNDCDTLVDEDDPDLDPSTLATFH